MEFFKDLFSLVGRVLISSVFLWGAYEKIKHWHQSISYMKQKGVPQVHTVLPIVLAAKILGGLSVFFGWHAHIGALILLVIAVLSLLKLHDFWNREGNERMMEQMIFSKEVAIIGGLFMILAMGAGHFGVGGGG